MYAVKPNVSYYNTSYDDDDDMWLLNVHAFI